MKNIVILSALVALMTTQPAEASILSGIGKVVMAPIVLPCRVVGYLYGKVCFSLIEGVYTAAQE